MNITNIKNIKIILIHFKVKYLLCLIIYRKKVPDWLLDKIDAKGISIWFMDCSIVNKFENNEIVSIIIRSNKYDEETHMRFINKFEIYI